MDIWTGTCRHGHTGDAHMDAGMQWSGGVRVWQLESATWTDRHGHIVGGRRRVAVRDSGVHRRRHRRSHGHIDMWTWTYRHGHGHKDMGT
eukprot:3021039-Rhodomonas_salina.3